MIYCGDDSMTDAEVSRLFRDALRRHAVAADDETSGWGRADGSEAGAPADVPEAPPTLHGCAEAWPNLPTGAAGAAPSCPLPSASHASRWPGAGRLSQLLARVLRWLGPRH